VVGREGLPARGLWCALWQAGADAFHTAFVHRPHSSRTRRAVVVRRHNAALSRRPARAPFGGAASAVPDLTPTPRGPEAEVGNGGGGKSRRQAGGTGKWGKPEGNPPQSPGFPSGFPRTPVLTPSEPTQCLRYAGAQPPNAQAGRRLARNHRWHRPEPRCG